MSFPIGQANPAKLPEVRKILSEQKLGSKNPRWKNGKIKVYSHGNIDRTNPYIKTLSRNHPNKDQCNRVFEHILVMEAYIKRYLWHNEIVHHINGIKSDNIIENLELMTISDHNRTHMTGRIVSKETRKKMKENWYKHPIGYGITHYSSAGKSGKAQKIIH